MRGGYPPNYDRFSREEQNARYAAKISATKRGEPADDRTPAFSDEALALRFADRHVGDLRFVAAWNKWLVWNETRWVFDETLCAFDLSRQICRTAATECNKPKAAAVIASARTVYAVERLARADRRLAATVDQWDADPWALNTPDGVVDRAMRETG